MSLGHLKGSYARHGLVLVLGAGVSVGSGLPAWDELLARVAADAGVGPDAGLVEELRQGGVSLPGIASVLQQYGGTDKFREGIRRALYRDFPFFPNGISKSNRGELVKHVRDKNSTLRAVASLCAQRAEGEQRFSPNPRIRAVVSFNLDAVLQAYVYARYEKRLLRTIDRASAQAVPDRINVYHMHGFLRFDAKAGNRAREAPDLVVLTESDYFDRFNDPTSLFNYTFLYLLREWPCLFIGLSMQDNNIRRLLHFSRDERGAALKSERRTAEPDASELRRHFAILKRSESSRLDSAVEDALGMLGTHALWVDDHGEIGPRLRDVYETAGCSWDSVS